MYRQKRKERPPVACDLLAPCSYGVVSVDADERKDAMQQNNGVRFIISVSHLLRRRHIHHVALIANRGAVHRVCGKLPSNYSQHINAELSNGVQHHDSQHALLDISWAVVRTRSMFLLCRRWRSTYEQLGSDRMRIQVLVQLSSR